MDPTTAVEIYSDLNLPKASIFVTVAIILVTLPVSALAGFLFGRRVRARDLQMGRDTDFMAGETTLGAFLALLGLLLAFTFGNALSYFNERKAAMTTEANAISTAFLRADMLAEEDRVALQRLLLSYADTRLTSASDPSLGQESAFDRLQRSLELQSQLWPLAVEATVDPMSPATRTFVLSSINEVLDAHMVRIASLSLPISEFANAMMLVSALAAVFLLGNRLGMTGRKMTWRTYFFTSFLFVVMITIIDTQRATEGLIVIDETPIKAAIYDMQIAMR